MDVLIVFFFVVLTVLSVAWYLGYKKRKSEFKHFFFPVKTIKIDSMTFVIRKINILDYLEGAKVISETFAIYRKEKPSLENFDVSNTNKLKKYLTDVICAGTVKPKFVRDKALAINENELPIEDLFNDWILAQKLAQEIFDFTHGKKN